MAIRKMWTLEQIKAHKHYKYWQQFSALHNAEPAINSCSSLARRMGKSPTYVSQVLNMKYPGNWDIVLKQIKQFMELNAQRAVSAGSEDFPFVETQNAAIAMDIFKHALHMGAITMLTGTAGTGKTRALKQFCGMYPGDVQYLYINSSMKFKSLINVIAESCGATIVKNYTSETFNNIVARLKERKICFCFDEAQKLNDRCLEVVRELNDITECGMVLVGARGLYEFITQGKSMGGDQLQSRIQRHHELEHNTKADFLLMLKTLFPNTTEAVAEYAYSKTVATGRLGNARDLRNMIKLIRRLNIDEITMDNIDTVAGVLVYSQAA